MVGEPSAAITHEVTQPLSYQSNIDAIGLLPAAIPERTVDPYDSRRTRKDIRRATEVVRGCERVAQPRAEA